MTTAERLITIEEFEAFLRLPENADRFFELINGEIVEKVTTEEHMMIIGNLYAPMREFIKKNDLGRVTFEVRRRNPNDLHNSRQPDLDFTRKERLQPVVKKGAAQLPDLAVEVKSPDDSMKSLREKAAYYLANGVSVVWLIHPKKQLVFILSIDNEDEEILDINDTLNGGDLLPGFTLPVRDLFDY